MQKVTIFDCDHLFEAGNFRCTQVNNYSPNISRNIDKDYLNCLKTSKKLVKDLEHSLKKTREYEDELARCKHDNVCKHRREKICNDSLNDYPKIAKTLSPRSQNSGTGSHSTIRVVGLQYQYEELCDYYDSLLRALDRCCRDDVRDAALHLRTRIQKTHEELSHLHTSLMTIAEKYLTLKNKKKLQKKRYRDRIAKLKQTLPDLMLAVEKKHLELTERLSKFSCMKHDAAVTLLVAEMAKSNDLLLENIRLKTQLEMLTMD